MSGLNDQKSEDAINKDVSKLKPSNMFKGIGKIVANTKTKLQTAEHSSSETMKEALGKIKKAAETTKSKFTHLGKNLKREDGNDDINEINSQFVDDGDEILENNPVENNETMQNSFTEQNSSEAIKETFVKLKKAAESTKYKLSHLGKLSKNDEGPDSTAIQEAVRHSNNFEDIDNVCGDCSDELEGTKRHSIGLEKINENFSKVKEKMTEIKEKVTSTIGTNFKNQNEENIEKTCSADNSTPAVSSSISVGEFEFPNRVFRRHSEFLEMENDPVDNAQQSTRQISHAHSISLPVEGVGMSSTDECEEAFPTFASPTAPPYHFHSSKLKLSA